MPESPLPERTRNQDPLPREAVLLPRVAGPARRDDVSFGGPPTADERDDMVHGERLWRELAAAIVASSLRSLPLPPLAATELPGSCTLLSNLRAVGGRGEDLGWICHGDEAIGDQ